LKNIGFFILKIIYGLHHHLGWLVSLKNKSKAPKGTSRRSIQRTKAKHKAKSKAPVEEVSPKAYLHSSIFFLLVPLYLKLIKIKL